MGEVESDRLFQNMIVKLKEYVDSKQIDKLLMYLSFKKDHIQTYIDVCIKKDKITKLYLSLIHI